MLKNEEMQQEKELDKHEEQAQPVYNTYNERGHINVGALIITVVALITLCCIPFRLLHGEPTTYIADVHLADDAKLMVAILLTMILFYILCFDMLAFCVATVNAAFLVINTFNAGFKPLSGYYILYACSFLVLVVHFLYPYLAKKIRNRKKNQE